MGALHCVTDNHMHIYTARASGEIKDMRRPLRFRTSTRGFATTVELQQAMSRGPVLARRLRRRQSGNRRELRGRGSVTVERWWLRVEQPHAPAACASWQPHHATRRCSSTMSSIGRRANTMHLCTENIRSRSRSHRRLPSKIHAATPAQNLAAV